MNRIITPQDYQNMKDRVGKYLVIIKDKLTDLQQQTSQFRLCIQKEASMIDNHLNITGLQME